MLKSIQKQILVTVITPIYNSGYAVKKFIKKLARQTYGFSNIEIILVNDGSEDNTDEVCAKIQRKYSNVKYFKNSHIGVSGARNIGIKNATGKYIFYVDVDDEISDNSILDCVNCFEMMYEEVDLLTYPITTYYKGKKLEQHFRYKYLTENGVYDLCKEAFVGQTTMNIVVKNKYSQNVLFDESISFSEDQKYCCDVLHEKLKMGFCKTANYIYYRDDESSSGRLSGSCFIFEKSLNMFENIFARYQYVPVAFQGLFVNDVYWKMVSNIFFPYYLNEKDYQIALVRVKELLKKCYNYVILDHPHMDYYEKFFLLRLKGIDSINIKYNNAELEMYSEGYKVFESKNIEAVITKFRITNNRIHINGFLKTAFFQFYTGKIDLVVYENGLRKRKLELKRSSHSYYLSHEATQNFFAFEYELLLDKEMNVEFKVILDNDVVVPTVFYMMPLIPFSDNNTTYKTDDYIINVENNCLFQILRNYQKRKNKRHQVWLYYDCRGVKRDNALIQFNSDVKKNDGIQRYYILTDSRQKKYIEKKRNTVVFGSKKHKKLFVKADKVVTAYIEENNIIPFTSKEYDYIAERIHFETIYLQHGVLHVDMPWKYSVERILADRVIVSSDVDYRLFKGNGYKDVDLCKAGMPRFDKYHDQAVRKPNKILYAPSWRSYLSTYKEGGKWCVLERKLKTSSYFLGINKLLESEELKNLLEENGFHLDIKLHPIMQRKKKDLLLDNEFISFVDDVKEEDYSLFITDFSSYMFDFLYLKIPVLFYIPDYYEFMSGMNGYRMVDYMKKIDKSEISKNYNQLIKQIDRFIHTGDSVKYDVNFFNYENDRTNQIYEFMMKQV